MSVELILYLIDFIGNVTLFLGSVAVVCLVVAFMLFIHEDEEFTKSKMFLVISFALLGILCFLPSPKTMYMMVGARYLKDSTIPTKVHDIIDKKLTELLGDGK